VLWAISPVLSVPGTSREVSARLHRNYTRTSRAAWLVRIAGTFHGLNGLVNRPD
jgi:hypothetical protein